MNKLTRRAQVCAGILVTHQFAQTAQNPGWATQNFLKKMKGVGHPCQLEDAPLFNLMVAANQVRQALYAAGERGKHVAPLQDWRREKTAPFATPRMVCI